MSNVPLSKNAQKKLARQEKYQENKLLRRAKEKEQRKEKNRIRAEKRAAGELDDDSDNRQRAPKRPRVHTNFKGRLVVDLGFDDKMTDKEIVSLTSQLAYLYSINRQSGFPFHLIFTSLNGRTYERLEGLSDAGYKRWAHTDWWPEGYERLWSAVSSGDREQPREPAAETASISDSGAPPEFKFSARDSSVNADNNTASQSTVAPEPESLSQANAPMEGTIASQTVSEANNLRDKVVYLTADSEYELLELEEDETYIIGGIVDHNRYKNLCLNKATSTGVRHARLPIGRFLAQLPTRKVLTVNQVVEILARWVETRDWEQALHAVVPKRKFNAAGKKGKGGKSATDEVDDENDGAAEDVEGNTAAGQPSEKEPVAVGDALPQPDSESKETADHEPDANTSADASGFGCPQLNDVEI